MNTIIDIINAVADRMEGWDPEPTRVVALLGGITLAVLILQTLAWAVR